MTDSQLYLAIGVPGTVALIGILVNIGYFIVINGRLTALEAKVGTVAEQTAAHKALLDIVLKKVDEIDAQLHR